MTDSSFLFPQNSDVILDRRAQILSTLCDHDEGFADIPVRSIRRATLETMLRLYDEAFFSGYLKNAYQSLSVTLSSRMISSAGKFLYARSGTQRKQKAEIRMSSDFLQRLEYGPFTLNGLSVSTPQEAFLLVFEHELCHALETALYGTTSHGRQFMMLANRFFGHTKAIHSLPTRKTEAAEKGLTVGSFVRFMFENKPLSGQITYIGKTATVMVPDAKGSYQNSRGRRFTKYRVPLDHLKADSFQ